jgi:ectoine hydroxylase-related dioxygenase (phytanoyl-CoA dioxygenase family)
MNQTGQTSRQIATKGYAVVPGIFQAAEIEELNLLLQSLPGEGAAYRKTADLFAIRQFFMEVPEAVPLVFNTTLRQLVRDVCGPDYFVVKSIYFNKPPASNWFVAWHQDLTISVNTKANVPGYGPWTVKQEQYAVQPPVQVLEHNFTIRLHLDDTTAENGALKVIEGSHGRGVVRPETIDRAIEKEVTCAVPAGGAMLMKPLLLHASDRTVNARPRRVIHIEFSNRLLPEPLAWRERLLLPVN